MPESKNPKSDWRKSFLQQLDNSLLLPAAEKKFWSETLPQLPPLLVELIGNQIQNSNQQIDQFIRLALAADTSQQFLNELKSVIQKTTRNIQGAKERSEKKSAEQKIEKQIENL